MNRRSFLQIEAAKYRDAKDKVVTKILYENPANEKYVRVRVRWLQLNKKKPLVWDTKQKTYIFSGASVNERAEYFIKELNCEQTQFHK
jgi:hypothetical protein